jgi:hypothetical protein
VAATRSPVQCCNRGKQKNRVDILNDNWGNTYESPEAWQLRSDLKRLDPTPRKALLMFDKSPLKGYYDSTKKARHFWMKGKTAKISGRANWPALKIS